jgi:hypothetical protein
VKVVEVTWDGKGQPAENDTTSCYELVLHGECALKSGLQTKMSSGNSGSGCDVGSPQVV